jgi:hypothetical protein
MNDEGTEKILYDLSTSLANIGDLHYDITNNTVSVCTTAGANGSSYANLSIMGTQQRPIEEVLSIEGDGTIRIGETRMSVPEFEACMKHLLKLTKDANPEEFI